MNNLEKQLLEIQEKIEEVKLWQSLVDNPPFQDKRHKFQNVLELTNKILIQFAQDRIDSIQGRNNKPEKQLEIRSGVLNPKNLQTQSPIKPLLKPENPQDLKGRPASPPPLNSSPKTKREVTENYKNKQTQSLIQPISFGIQEGQKAKLISTMSLSAVNEVQASKFVSGDEVKIIRTYRNQYGEDVAEIIKNIDTGMVVKAVISIEDLQ